FPSLGVNWSGGGSDSNPPYRGVYTFTSSAGAPSGNQDVTATNAAGLDSTPTSFSVVADTTAPTTSISCNGSACAGWYTSSADSESGVASYSFPNLGSGWSASGSDPSRTYSFSASAVDPGEPNDVTATNNAGLTSNPSSFTVTADSAAPITSVACTGGCAG